jgi:hypothetical protein
MDDKLALPNVEQGPSTGVSGGPQGSAENSGDEGFPDHRQGTFADDFNAITDQLGEACERSDIEVAFMVVKDPKTGLPAVFARGHQYDAISLAARVVKTIQQEMMAELMGEAAE